jgi:hypothetical protein
LPPFFNILNSYTILTNQMNGSQFWELYKSYGDVYRQEVLSEEVEVEEGGSQQLNRLSGTARRAGKVNSSYEYDLYDVVLEHLLDGGFADTLEDAQVLMANMSEQWIDSIVEASEDSEVAGELAKLRGQMRTAMQKGDDSSIQSISRRLAEIQPSARAKIGAVLKGKTKRQK